MNPQDQGRGRSRCAWVWDFPDSQTRTEQSSTSDVERTATHESAHAAAAFMLQRRVDLISIVPGARYSGITFLRAAPRGGEPNLLRPMLLQPARFRRWVETEIVTSLAGPLAAFYLAPDFETGYVPLESDEEHAEKLARLAVLTPAESEKLANAAEKSHPTDEERADKLAWAAAGEETAQAYLFYLRAETARMVKGSRFRSLVSALVPVLLQRKTIGDRLATMIMRSAERRYES